jgi:hypothetical protein
MRADARNRSAAIEQTRKDRSEVECEPTASALPLKMNPAGAVARPVGSLGRSLPPNPV